MNRGSAPARNSNSGPSDAAVLSRPAGLAGVLVLSESEMAKYYQLQQVPRDADACAVVVITAWWTKLRRTSWDLKDLDKLGINLETSLAVIALAPPPVDSVVTVIRALMEALNQLDAAVTFTLPLSPTSPNKAGSRNPPPPISPLLIQLCTVSKMTAYGERLGDDAMGMQGRRASLAGVLAGGVGFVSCLLLFASLLILPLSPSTSSKAGSRNPPPLLSPFWSNLILSLK